MVYHLLQNLQFKDKPAIRKGLREKAAEREQGNHAEHVGAENASRPKKRKK